MVSSCNMSSSLDLFILWSLFFVNRHWEERIWFLWRVVYFALEYVVVNSFLSDFLYLFLYFFSCTNIVLYVGLLYYWTFGIYFSYIGFFFTRRFTFPSSSLYMFLKCFFMSILKHLFWCLFFPFSGHHVCTLLPYEINHGCSLVQITASHAYKLNFVT